MSLGAAVATTSTSFLPGSSPSAHMWRAGLASRRRGWVGDHDDHGLARYAVRVTPQPRCAEGASDEEPPHACLSRARAAHRLQRLFSVTTTYFAALVILLVLATNRVAVFGEEAMQMRSLHIPYFVSVGTYSARSIACSVYTRSPALSLHRIAHEVSYLRWDMPYAAQARRVGLRRVVSRGTVHSGCYAPRRRQRVPHPLFQIQVSQL